MYDPALDTVLSLKKPTESELLPLCACFHAICRASALKDRLTSGDRSVQVSGSGDQSTQEALYLGHRMDGLEARLDSGGVIT